MERFSTPTSGPLRVKPRPGEEDASLGPLGPMTPIAGPQTGGDVRSGLGFEQNASAATPERVATPSSGPLTTAPIPPPPASPDVVKAATAGRVAAPDNGPLVANPTTGTATHQPAPAPPPQEDTLGDPNAAPRHADGGPDVAAPPAVNTAYRDALLKLLDTKDPSMDDPALAAQSGAYGVQQQRAKERARSAMAERFAAGAGPGVDSGAFNSEILGMEQAQGEAQGAFDAGLLQKELERRQNQLMQAAALAGSQMNEEDRLALQRESMEISEKLDRLRIDQQGSQFDRSFGASLDQFEKQFGLEGKRLAETVRQFDVNTETGRQQLKQQLEMFKESQAQQGRQFDVDAELKRLGITTQGDIASADNATRRYGIDINSNLGLLDLLLRDSQFGRGLSADLGKFNSSQNNSYLQALLAALGQAA